jgi:hypothetical protein
MRSGPRYREVVFPLILVAVGAIALLANTHVLTQQAIDNLAALWPLILVVIGAQLVFNRTLPPRASGFIGAAFGAAVIVLALVVAMAGPAIVPSGTSSLDSSAPLGSAEKASLSLESGASSITVRGQDLGSRLYQAHIEYPSGQGKPDIRLDSSGTVHISPGSGRFFGGLFSSGSFRVDLMLSTHLPWSIAVGGGVSDMQLNVPTLRLSTVEVGGGASNIVATLPAPTGTDTIAISGGVSDVTLHLPTSAQWRIQVSGGASSVQVNGHELSSDNNVSQASSGFEGATDRYDITVSGGASNVIVDTSGSAAS